MGWDAVFDAVKILGISLMFIALLVFIFFMYRYEFPLENVKNITFNVVGVNQSANATSVVDVQFECIKYCIDYTSSDYGVRDKCYAECEKLGK